MNRKYMSSSVLMITSTEYNFPYPTNAMTP
jgi:hypothetical protein